jgi:hypothetical protein
MSNVSKYYCNERRGTTFYVYFFWEIYKPYNFISLLPHKKNILRHVYKQLYISFLAPVIFGRSNQKLLPRIDTFLN